MKLNKILIILLLTSLTQEVCSQEHAQEHFQQSAVFRDRSLCLIPRDKPQETCEKEIDVIYYPTPGLSGFELCECGGGSDYDTFCNFMATPDTTNSQDYINMVYPSDYGFNITEDTSYVILMNDDGGIDISYFVTIIINEITTDSIYYSFNVSEPWGMTYFKLEPFGKKSLDAALYKANDCQDKYSHKDDEGDVDIEYNSDTGLWTVTPLGNARVAYYSDMESPCEVLPLSPRVFTKGVLGGDNNEWTSGPFNLPMALLEYGYVLIKTNAGNYGYFTNNAYSATVYSGDGSPCGKISSNTTKHPTTPNNESTTFLYFSSIFMVLAFVMCSARSVFKYLKENNQEESRRLIVQ